MKINTSFSKAGGVILGVAVFACSALYLGLYSVGYMFLAITELLDYGSRSLELLGAAGLYVMGLACSVTAIQLLARLLLKGRETVSTLEKLPPL
jgi:hypothetical protein